MTTRCLVRGGWDALRDGNIDFCMSDKEKAQNSFSVVSVALLMKSVQCKPGTMYTIHEYLNIDLSCIDPLSLPMREVNVMVRRVNFEPSAIIRSSLTRACTQQP